MNETIEQYKEFIERMTGVKVVKVKKQPPGTIKLIRRPK